MVNLFWLFVSIIAMIFGLAALDKPLEVVSPIGVSLVLFPVLGYGLLVRPIKAVIEEMQRTGNDWLDASGPYAWQIGIFLSLLTPFQLSLGIFPDGDWAGLIWLLGGSGLVVGFLIGIRAWFQLVTRNRYEREMRRFAETFWRYSPRPPHQ